MEYTLFKKELLIAGITKEEFSEMTHTPHSTLQGWATSRTNKQTPKWVKPYLDLYIENRKNKIIIEDLKKGSN